MKKKTHKTTLEDVVKAAHKAGAKVTFSLEDKKMPMRLAGDHPHVLALLDESERLNALAARWQNADPGNPIAVQVAQQQGYSMALAGAYLRCYLKGELLVKPKP